MIKKFLLLGLLGIWINAGAWEWDTMTVDTTQNSGIYGADIAVDSLNNPHLVYFISAKGLVYAKWDPVDSIWVREFFEDSAKSKNPGVHPSLALDSKGYPHISFDIGGYAYKDSSGWHIEYPLGGVSEGTSIALDKNDYPHIGYVGTLPAGTVPLHVYFDGEYWVADIVDTIKGATPYNISVCVDKWDTVHIAYGELSGGKQPSPGFGYAKRTSSGWEKEYVDTEWTGWYGAIDISMALNSSGHPCIAYKPMRSSDGAKEIRYAEKTGTEWIITRVDTAAAPYTDVKNWSRSPTIRIDKNDNPHIVYNYHPTESSDDPCCLKYAWRNDGKWYFDTIDSLATTEYHCQLVHYGLVIDKESYSHIGYGGEVGAGGGKMKYAKGRADTFGVTVVSKQFKTLLNVYPNIGNKRVKITYSMKKEGKVNISIYDIGGRKVEELVKGIKLAGEHTAYWETDNISNGVYFCVFKSKKEQLVKKFVVMK